MTFPTEPLSLPDPVRTAMLRYAEDTANHKMTVLHEDGLYRHLRFRDPQNMFYWFDIHTAPNLLTINGDMQTFVFRHSEQDMFDLFWKSSGGISPGYWTEKLVADSGSRRYSADLFKQAVVSAFLDEASDLPDDKARAELWLDLENQVLDDCDYEHVARESLANFTHNGFIFADTGDWSFDDYTAQYLWCQFAIVDAIRHFRSRPAEVIAA